MTEDNEYVFSKSSGGIEIISHPCDEFVTIKTDNMEKELTVEEAKELSFALKQGVHLVDE